MEGTCFLCGNWETVERHHIFGGARRKKADKLKLTVMLCPYCHQYDADSAHRSAETRLYLHKYCQKKAMVEQKWTIEDFIREFGKNYLDAQDIEDMLPAPIYELSTFKVLEEADLPW
jgi:hypothetical protein